MEDLNDYDDAEGYDVIVVLTFDLWDYNRHNLWESSCMSGNLKHFM